MDAVIQCLSSSNRASIKEFYCPEESDERKLIAQVIQSIDDARISAQIDQDLQSMLTAESENFLALSSRVSAMFDKTPVETRYPSAQANYRDLLLATCNPQNNLNSLFALSQNKEFREKYKNLRKQDFPTINTNDPTIVSNNYLEGCSDYEERKIQAYKQTGVKIAIRRTDLSSERIRNEYVSKMSSAYEELLNKLNYYAGIVARIVGKFPNFTGQ